MICSSFDLNKMCVLLILSKKKNGNLKPPGIDYVQLKIQQNAYKRSSFIY